MCDVRCGVQVQSYKIKMRYEVRDLAYFTRRAYRTRLSEIAPLFQFLSSGNVCPHLPRYLSV
jgi:hypothetical protein